MLYVRSVLIFPLFLFYFAVCLQRKVFDSKFEYGISKVQAGQAPKKAASLDFDTK